MRILVTGATGFVGACLARRMVQSGHEVSITVREQSDKWRIADMSADLRQHCCDLRDADAVSALVQKVKPDAVFHLATYGGFSFQRDSRTILEANFLGLANLVRACEKIDLDCFVNTGSSSEYGVKDHPMREDEVLEPLGDYGVTKAAASLFCRSEALLKQLPIVTLRLFSPYGPWDDPKRLIPYLIATAMRGEELRLSRPEYVRDFVYIDDVTTAYERVLATRVSPGEIINIGSGVQTSLGELVGHFGSLLPIPHCSWGAVPAKKVEPERWLADRSKAASLLGWQPEHDLNAGLAKTVSWMKEHSCYYQ